MSRPPPQSTLVLELLEAKPGFELFHTPGGHDSEAYATFPVGSHRETWAISSRGFKSWLARQFYLSEGTALRSQSMTDALSVLSAKAIHEGPENAVSVRFAERDRCIWLDLCDAWWRAVRISESGWQVVELDIPVKFVRKRGMLPLPTPEVGGSLELLKRVVNLGDPRLFILAASWLVAAVRPNRAYAVLNVSGEQGSAKSTLCKILRSVLDPAGPLLRRPAKDERDLMIAAGNSGVVAFDNISGLSPSLSDALCSLSTGGGFATRELYSDDGEKLFESTRPIILNGIDDSVTRPDLLDRSVNLSLSRISDEQRRDEDDVWDEFRRLHPLILGAVLTAASTGLANIHTTRVSSKPRMADFVQFVCAAEPGLPWEPGAFLKAYRVNRDEAVGIALESSLIGGPILGLLGERGTWCGTAGALRTELMNRFPSLDVQLPRDWPPNAKAMANAIRRIAPSLRSSGVKVELPTTTTGHDKARIFRFERSPASSSATPASTAVVGGGDDSKQPSDDPPAHAASAAQNGWDVSGHGTGVGSEYVPSADDADDADDVPGPSHANWPG